MQELAQAEQIDTDCMTLFYYEIYSEECDYPSEDSSELIWIPLRTEASSLAVNVHIPCAKTIWGYDVLLADNIGAISCSLLSCSRVAEEFQVNEHCLFDTFEEAKAAVLTGKFHERESFPYRIFAVYTSED